MRAAGDESGKVRHIDHILCAHFVSNLSHAREVDDARISAASANDQFGALALCNLLEFVIIYGLSVLAHAVGDDLVHLAGEIQRMAVSEMSAMRQVQPEH